MIPQEMLPPRPDPLDNANSSNYTQTIQHQCRTSWRNNTGCICKYDIAYTCVKLSIKFVKPTRGLLKFHTADSVFFVFFVSVLGPQTKLSKTCPKNKKCSPSHSQTHFCATTWFSWFVLITKTNNSIYIYIYIHIHDCWC